MMSSPSEHPETGTIYVVDDDQRNLNALARLLGAIGLETVAFVNPRLFLEYMKDHSVSLAIIDLRMPELNGLEVRRMLYDICPEVPVIIMTGEQEPRINRTNIPFDPSLVRESNFLRETAIGRASHRD